MYLESLTHGCSHGLFHVVSHPHPRAVEPPVLGEILILLTATRLKTQYDLVVESKNLKEVLMSVSFCETSGPCSLGKSAFSSGLSFPSEAAVTP